MLCIFKFISAITTRLLFIFVSLLGIFRVTIVKWDDFYLLLTLLFLPLLVEMIITLKCRKGQDYKWFSPAIFLFLISVIPSIWILELDRQEHRDSIPQGNVNGFQCKKLGTWQYQLPKIPYNETVGNLTSQQKVSITRCPYDWILALHQSVLILVIVGKWLLPKGGGVTRDELSQLLIMFVGTAADILEFTSETLSDVKDDSQQLVYIILAVWTWSMLQFPLHLAGGNSIQPDTDDKEAPSEVSLLAKHSTDILSILVALFIQDVPFLVVRLFFMIYFDVFHQMILFFAIKNSLVVTLNLYRLVVICLDSRSRAGRGSAVPSV
ncbi:transmembrane protein 26 [Gasterosteus aculeatus]|uniref:Transmembrane protein 26a n=1 Tax=Gasterosteus aculeatus aculeatus TaxID=481459 RepID=G3P8T0_GASAC|nr:transmembrane protein 26-like [Gasterosteus aculeatus aculeatus]